MSTYSKICYARLCHSSLLLNYRLNCHVLLIGIFSIVIQMKQHLQLCHHLIQRLPDHVTHRLWTPKNIARACDALPPYALQAATRLLRYRPPPHDTMTKANAPFLVDEGTITNFSFVGQKKTNRYFIIVKIFPEHIWVRDA
jgi:hypothetical protein